LIGVANATALQRVALKYTFDAAAARSIPDRARWNELEMQEFRATKRHCHSSVIGMPVLTRHNFVNGRAFVHGDVLGLVALYFVLRVARGAVTRMSLVLGIAGMDLDNPTADMACFRIPADAVADLEFHDNESSSLQGRS
jgi:hypothetical protein